MRALSGCIASESDLGQFVLLFHNCKLLAQGKVLKEKIFVQQQLNTRVHVRACVCITFTRPKLIPSVVSIVVGKKVSAGVGRSLYRRTYKKHRNGISAGGSTKIWGFSVVNDSYQIGGCFCCFDTVLQGS